MKFSIRYKIFLSFSLLIISVFIIMNFITRNTIKNSNEMIISKELVKESNNITIYVRQFFLLNNIESDKASFHKHSSEVLSDLEAKLSIKGALYSTDGEPLELLRSNLLNISGVEKDLSNALNKKLSFTIRSRGNHSDASISVPIIVEANFLGVLRYTKDYSDLYSSGYYLSNILTITIFIMLLIMFIASYVISDGIIRPLSKLNSMAKDMTNGEFSGKIDVMKNDEIGELTSSFITMREQIHTNIKTIERDHVRLKELESYRKKFFDNVAHEFKTPVTTIRGYTQIMNESDFDDKEFCKKGAGYILDECDRLHKMVQSLLTISKQTSKNMESLFEDVNISALLNDTCEEMRLMAANRTMHVLCEISPDIQVFGYPDDLKSVFINILDNAIKYGYEKSAIKVKAYSESRQATIIIINEGNGIPFDKIEKVFEPFFQIYDGSGKRLGGSGLGLSIVKAIIEKHSGTIQIESIKNAFTKVIITIPEEFTV